MVSIRIQNAPHATRNPARGRRGKADREMSSGCEAAIVEIVALAWARAGEDGAKRVGGGVNGGSEACNPHLSPASGEGASPSVQSRPSEPQRLQGFLFSPHHMLPDHKSRVAALIEQALVELGLAAAGKPVAVVLE